MDKPSKENPKKYKINLHCTEDGQWYLKSLSINVDTKEEFKETVEEAMRVVKHGFSPIEKTPNKPTKLKVQESKLSPEGNKLLEKLKTKRSELANQKNLPSYIIFPNKTLASLASLKPNSKQEMLSIQGIGEKKFETYGEIFLKEIRDFNK